MSPIEQVRPTQPGNWTRRVDPRNKRGGEQEAAHERRKKDRQEGDPKQDPDGREHIVDELA